MKTWALLSFTGCGISLLLCGCGGGTTPVAVSPLAGNWLLVGPMPTNGISFPPSSPPSAGVRLAMTFDVVGDQVIAGASGSNYCDNVQASFTFAGVASGILAADGSFTATPNTLSIKGTAPKKSGEPWSGSYAASFGGPLTPACDTNLSGTFTATSFPLVSGVYVGTGTTLVVSTGVPKAMPVTVQVTLQQGGRVTSPGNGAASNYFSNTLLTGNIKVQGSPCFSSGATQTTPASSVVGNMVSARFLMDDGSTLTVLGPLTDVTEGHIATGIIQVQGGNCGGVTSDIVLPALDRQG